MPVPTRSDLAAASDDSAPVCRIWPGCCTSCQALFGAYGVFIDELYYVSCAKRLAWGYVDHPPLAPFLLRGALAIFGDSIVALRVPAATCGALVVFLTGWISRPARRLAIRTGDRLRGGRLVAAAAGAVRVLLDERHRAGVVAGAGRHAHRDRATRRRALVAALWRAGRPRAAHQAHRDDVRGGAWRRAAAHACPPASAQPVAVGRRGSGAGPGRCPTRSGNRRTDGRHWSSIATPRCTRTTPPRPARFCMQQALFMSPGVLPVTLAGLAWLWRRPGAQLRHIPVQFVVMLGAADVVGAEPARSAGGPLPSALCGRRRLAGRAGRGAVRIVRIALPIWIARVGSAAASSRHPAAVARPDRAAPGAARHLASVRARRRQAHAAAPVLCRPARMAAAGRRRRGRARHAAAGGTHARRVLRAELRAGQRARLAWRVASAGAGLLDPQHVVLLGPARVNPEVAIVLGDDRESLEALFGEVTQSRVHECGACMPWRNHMPIWIVRKPKVQLADKWPGWKKFE